MNKTKIDWCDSTWNPVTGCLHECEYCYARGIAKRFGGASETHCNETVGTECQWETSAEGKIHVLSEPIYDYDHGRNAPYPYEFDPTFHKYRLNEYQNKKGRNIFVCSMADLFGEWVPDEWIEEVFEACDNAPQHNYLFLTKNPFRYEMLHQKGILRKRDNMWYGYSMPKNDCDYWYDSRYKTFESMEPLLEMVAAPHSKWTIIGAETGHRKNKVVPEAKWIAHIVNQCRRSNIPVFMKSSLADIWGEPLIQEFPEELKRK